jgi:hypothetical protein
MDPPPEPPGRRGNWTFQFGMFPFGWIQFQYGDGALPFARNASARLVVAFWIFLLLWLVFFAVR